ncbi:hypothetical protein PoB_004222900 [Plakobranchus ocellatus]|uniref:Uncharacterized protein n=1 Tax=Plakobranchus ocellatus TaxID=259542 RepID=A0AAV4B6J9_9GAST|nr:hypothetical protein PoB_004222900 [Plakobranchus ocellatus]
MPDARALCVKNEEMKPRRVLEMSLLGAFDHYRKKDQLQVPYSSFKELRLQHLLPFTSHKFRECLCEYCMCIVLITKAVNTFLSPEKRIKDHYGAQDAPQGCHWNNQQTTIHPIVATYRCNENNCLKIITGRKVFISDDLTHDHHAVHHLFTKAVKLLQSEEVAFSRVIGFSDGASTHYKNRISFAHCSHAFVDLKIMSERHFFGSRHGKGPCDREIEVIKTSVTRAVAARQGVVEFFNMCRVRLQLPPLQTSIIHFHSSVLTQFA